MNYKIKVAYSELKFTFSRSSGAGGQNVNKINSKVTMSWEIDLSEACRAEVKKRFKEKYKNCMVADVVIIHSQKFRSQKMNIDDCIEKLESLLNSVLLPPKKRLKTKPTRSSKKKRLDAKSKHSKQKALRSEKF